MRFLIATTVLVFVASTCICRTWHVATDGSGDFEVIQDAVNAASDGDTIWIHAGRYDEVLEDFAAFGFDNPYRADVHVGITKDNLTIRGDGPDVTIIGREAAPDPPPALEYVGICVSDYYATSLTVRDLKFEHTRTGVYASLPNVEITGCEFSELIDEGIFLNSSGGTTILDCQFRDTYRGIIAFYQTNDLLIKDSVFETSVGMRFVGASGVRVESCSLTGGIVAIDFQQSATGTVESCTAIGFDNVGLGVLSGAHVEIANCEIAGGQAGIYIPNHSTSLIGQDVTLTDQSYASIVIGAGDLELHDCDIINGGGFSVLCDASWPDPFHADLTDNYWGTDQADQIAEWIWDATDDPELSCTVDYIPFQGPVAVESHTWSDVKGLFRGDGK